jgi:hypothetical protein
MILLGHGVNRKIGNIGEVVRVGWRWVVVAWLIGGQVALIIPCRRRLVY